MRRARARDATSRDVLDAQATTTTTTTTDVVDDAHVPIARVDVDRTHARYFAVFGLGFVRVAEETRERDVVGAVFVAKALRDDERESLIAMRVRAMEAVVAASRARERERALAKAFVLTLPKTFGDAGDAIGEDAEARASEDGDGGDDDDDDGSETYATPRRANATSPRGARESGGKRTKSEGAASVDRSRASRSGSSSIASARRTSTKPKHSLARVRRNMKRRLERLDLELGELNKFIVDGALALGDREAAREALRRAQWRRVEHDAGIERLDGRELPPGVEELASPRSKEIFQRVACATGGLLMCAIEVDGIKRVDANLAPPSPDDVEDSWRPDASTLVAYDFAAETCSCDACLNMYVRAMLDRVCVCPDCLTAYSKALHEKDDVQAVDRVGATRNELNDEPREAKWDAIAKRAAVIARTRIRKRIEELMRKLRQPVLSLPPAGDAQAERFDAPWKFTIA